MHLLRPRPVAACLVALIASCGEPGDEDPTPAVTEHPPTPADLDRYCGETSWEETLTSARIEELRGDYAGFIDSGPTGGPMVPGTLEVMTITPEHPFVPRTLAVAFAEGEGPARLRIVRSYGRSYPAGFVDDGEDVDMVPPVDIEVADPDGDTWIEVDVTAAQAVLQPGSVYHIVYEHLGEGPFLAMEDVPEGESNRALLLAPGDVNAYGLPGNYRLALDGDFACAWSDEDRWMVRPVGVLDGFRSDGMHVADLNGDGHDDLAGAIGGQPQVFFGDGQGGFGTPGIDPFPDGEVVTVMAFGDLDNDGDEDAFVGVYTQSDADNDGTSLAEGDCNNSDPDIHPGAAENANNRRDDDCDGLTDGGSSTTDFDQDGYSIADGDCDDSDAAVHPGAPEILDNLDNDCNRTADEDFVHHVLRNDKGMFTRVPAAGVEFQGPTTVLSLADTNEDGFLDAFLGHWLRVYPEASSDPSLFFLGHGDGTFTESLAAAGMDIPTPHPVYGAIWNDWNNDGHEDLYVGNYQLRNNEFWQGDGTGQFTNVAATIGLAHDATDGPYPAYPGGHSYGGVFGDLDGDGDLDALLANLSHPRTMPWADPTMLVYNQGPPDYSFVNRREEMGIGYNEGDGNAHFGDYDNDGDLDMTISSFYGRFSRAFRNDGTEGFVDVTYELGLRARSGVQIWVDWNEDGWLDLVTSDNGTVIILLNQLPQDRHWVELRLHGTTVNRDAIGARITVTAGAQSWVREVRTTNGHMNRQASRWVHFGLGDANFIDSVELRWPGGETETVTGVGIDGRWEVVQGTGEVGAPPQ